MDIREAWLVKIHRNLLQQKELIHKKDFRFFQIDILLELARRSQIFSQTCTQCAHNKEIIEQLSQTVSDNLNTIKGRNKITKDIDAIIKHLRKKHRIFIKGYFIASYTFWGLVIGTLLFSVIAWIFHLNIMSFALLGFLIGLFIGRIVGNYFEKRASAENRLIKPEIISPLGEMIKKSQELQSEEVKNR